MLEINMVHEGDCVKMMKQLPPRCIDLIVTDPPYNASFDALKNDWKNYQSINQDWDRMNDYQEFTYGWIDEAIRVLKEGGSIYVFCSFHSIAEIINAMKGIKGEEIGQSPLLVQDVIVWHKTNSVPNLSQRGYAFSCEFIVWATKGKNWTFNYEDLKEINPERRANGKLKQMRDLWETPILAGKERLKREDGKSAHPTQKPEWLYEIMITTSSNEGDLILDCFAGTNTIGAVAGPLRRKWLGFEINPHYVEIGNARYKPLARVFGAKETIE